MFQRVEVLKSGYLQDLAPSEICREDSSLACSRSAGCLVLPGTPVLVGASLHATSVIAWPPHPVHSSVSPSSAYKDTGHFLACLTQRPYLYLTLYVCKDPLSK